jgi:hypothetical protein
MTLRKFQYMLPPRPAALRFKDAQKVLLESPARQNDSGLERLAAIQR